MGMNAYGRLMRLDKPTGTWLLFWPCVWGLVLGVHQLFSWEIAKDIGLFFLGALIMRSAGCIVNDIWDRKLDAKVVRTKMRPIASGEIKLWHAVFLLIILLGLALVVWFQLHWLARTLAALSLILVVAYPGMKRITWWPQAFLGITFNYGILMGAVQTAHVPPSIPTLIIYLGAMFWTIGYDTIYACQDIEDDRMVGVKSTALKFATAPRRFVALCFALAMLLWWMAAMEGAFAWPTYIGLLVVGAHFLWQLAEWNPKDNASSLRMFKANAITGGLMAGVVVLSKFF